MTGLLKLAVILSAVFFVAAGLVCLQPYNGGGVRAFLLASDGCPTNDDFSLCFMGIQPGITTGDQALALLQAHPWVSEVTTIHSLSSDQDTLVWGWSAAAPSYIDRRTSGLVTILRQNELVYSIALTTTVPFGDFRLALHPPRQSVFADASFSANIYQVETYATFFRARRMLPCPVPVEAFWKQPMAIWFGAAKAPDLSGTTILGSWSGAEMACAAESQAGFTP
jgi:hypothetical protein